MQPVRTTINAASRAPLGFEADTAGQRRLDGLTLGAVFAPILDGAKYTEFDSGDIAGFLRSSTCQEIALSNAPEFSFRAGA